MRYTTILLYNNIKHKLSVKTTSVLKCKCTKVLMLEKKDFLSNNNRSLKFQEPVDHLMWQLQDFNDIDFLYIFYKICSRISTHLKHFVLYQ